MTLLVLVTGCSSVKPDQVLKGFMDAMIKGNFEEADKYLDGNVDSLLNIPTAGAGEQVAKASLGKLTYQIGKTTISGDAAIVETNVTSPDMYIITSQVMDQAVELAITNLGSNVSEEQMQTMLLTAFKNAIASADAPMVSSRAEIKLIKQDGKWLVVEDEVLSNALTGNMVTAFSHLDGK